MKFVFALVSLVTLVSCLEKKEEKTEVLPTQYMIYSKQNLPKKMKVIFKNDASRVEAFSDCKTGSKRSAFLSEGNLMMGFRAVPGLYVDGMALEIVDAGENCDNNALFFEGFVTPKTTDSWENTKDTKTFTLEN